MNKIGKRVLVFGLALMLGCSSGGINPKSVKAADLDFNEFKPVHHHDTVDPKVNDTTDFHTIPYGMYPQSKVTDKSIIVELNEKELNAGEDVIYEGNTYRKVGGSNYYLWEPVRWRVLNVDNGQLILLSDKVIASKAYDKENGTNAWKDSAIRSWLNGEFYKDAFSSEEASTVKTTTIQTNGDETEDKVYLLSKAESMLEDYGLCPGTAQTKSRQFVGTEYANKQGVTIWKLLRDHGAAADKVNHIHGDGDLAENQCDIKSENGIIPVIRLDAASAQEIIKRQVGQIKVEKTKTVYEKGETIGTDDIQVTATYFDGTTGEVTDHCIFTMPETGTDDIGEQVICVTYQGLTEEYRLKSQE